MVSLTLCIFFAIFWIFGAYYLVVLTTSWSIGLYDGGNYQLPRSRVLFPKLAILYLTKNDFEPDAVLSLLRQDYPTFHVFVLDDSTDSNIRHEIDAFCGKYERVSVIRRPDRRGWKAGNLNYAIATVSNEYPVFAVMDADCVIPREFTRSLTYHLITQEGLAFVQAECRFRNDSGRFAMLIGPSTDAMWTMHRAYRQTFALPLFMGHGAVVRTSAWAAVNGFPEIIAEDIGFTLALVGQGLRGTYVSQPVCYESAPRNFDAFCGRQQKYVEGAIELLWRYRRSFLSQTGQGWFERLDLALFLTTNVVPGIFLLFVIVLASCIAVVVSRQSHIYIEGHSAWPIYVSDRDFRSALNGSFWLVSGVSMLIPFICAAMIRTIPFRRWVRFVSAATFLYLAILPECLYALLRLVRRTREVFVTGNRVRHFSTGPILAARLALGLLLMASAALTVNLYVAAVALAVLLGNCFLGAGECRGASLEFVMAIPFVVIMIGIVLLFTNLVQSP